MVEQGTILINKKYI